jgi:hypothetical protein
MDGFYSQNLGDHFGTVRGLPFRFHVSLPSAYRGRSKCQSGMVSRPASRASRTVASRELFVLERRLLAAFPLFGHYCSNRYLRGPFPVEIVSRRGKTLKKRKRTKLGKDKRRKHKHWQVTVFYKDGEKFGRVYTDRAKASKFAERQRKSPVVKTARVLQVS